MDSVPEAPEFALQAAEQLLALDSAAEVSDGLVTVTDGSCCTTQSAPRGMSTSGQCRWTAHAHRSRSSGPRSTNSTRSSAPTANGSRISQTRPAASRFTSGRLRDPGADVPVSTSGGSQVRWSPKGTELFYIGADDRLMTVPIRSTRTDSPVDVGDPAGLVSDQCRYHRTEHEPAAVRGVARRRVVRDELGPGAVRDVTLVGRRQLEAATVTTNDKRQTTND